MELKSRWMQKKDLKNIDNKDELLALLENVKVNASVIESDEKKILGWVIYKILLHKTKILKICFENKKVGDKIFEHLIEKNNKNNTIEAIVSDEDLEFHLLLKKNKFIAKGIKKVEDSDFYIFERKFK